MSSAVIGGIFLGVSLVSATLQGLAFRKLFSWPDVGTHQQNLVYRGLLRTSACRILAALMYVVAGIATLANGSTPAMLALNLFVFTVVQVMWQANSIADVQLRKKLARAVEQHQEE